MSWAESRITCMVKIWGRATEWLERRARVPEFESRSYPSLNLEHGHPSFKASAISIKSQLARDQCQISPGASPEILHQTVWRTLRFIAYSDEAWFMLTILTTSLTHFSLNVWENVLFQLGSERVKLPFHFQLRFHGMPETVAKSMTTTKHGSNVVRLCFLLSCRFWWTTTGLETIWKKQLRGLACTTSCCRKWP